MLLFYHSEKKSSVFVVSEAEMYNEFLEYLKQELASTDDSVVASNIKKHLKCCMRYTGWQGGKAFHTQNNTGASHGNLRPVAQTKACSTNGKGSKLFKE